MAYLTSYSFKQLCRETEVEIDSYDLYQFFRDYISKDYNLYKMFNKSNILGLLQKVALLSNDDFSEKIIIKRKYREVEERRDNYDYIFEIKGKVKYHLYKDCIFLDRGFRNFNVPEDFKALGIEAIVELRRWFIKNDFTLERYEKGEFHLDVVIMRYNAYFPKKYKELKELNPSYKLLEIKNSGGPREVKNILKELGEYSEERKELCNLIILDKFLSKYDYLHDKKDEEIKEKISSFNKKYDYVFWKHYTIKHLRDFWQKHHAIKIKVLELLYEFILIRYDIENKNFDEVILEKYNLECCKTCNDRHIIEKLLNTENTI